MAEEAATNTTREWALHLEKVKQDVDALRSCRHKDDWGLIKEDIDLIRDTLTNEHSEGTLNAHYKASGTVLKPRKTNLEDSLGWYKMLEKTFPVINQVVPTVVARPDPNLLSKQKLNEAKACTDIMKALTFYVYLQQLINDTPVQDLLWLAVLSRVFKLAPHVRSSKPPHEWPAKLRNSVAHGHLYVKKGVLVAFNLSVRKADDSSSADWHLHVNTDQLLPILLDIFGVAAGLLFP